LTTLIDYKSAENGGNEGKKKIKKRKENMILLI